MRVILALTLACVLAVALFPPYRVLYDSTVGGLFGAPPDEVTVYGWAGTGPRTGFHESLADRGSGSVLSAQVDVGRLLVSVLIVLALGGLAALVANVGPPVTALPKPPDGHPDSQHPGSSQPTASTSTASGGGSEPPEHGERLA